MLDELLRQASDFFERYDTMRATNRFSIPGVGITESEFSAWLSKAAGWIAERGRSADEMRRWRTISDIGEYMSDTRAPSHLLEPYEHRLRACVDFLIRLAGTPPHDPAADIVDDADPEQVHHNIRLLVSRMELQLRENDYAGVVHSSACIFETLAKDIVGLPSVQNQTLGGFFDRYAKVWRDNLGENGAAIRMRSGSRSRS